MLKYYYILKQYAEAQKVTLTQDKSIVCMMSKKNNLFHLIFPFTFDFSQILFELTKIIPENDRVMSAIICFLPPWNLEIPSFAFRKALLQIDDANQKAVIYMNGKDGVIQKELSETLPSL